ncbi:MAG: aromatic ring-hydroxylating dioxygenase subunit alpha [Blastocatellia bacterium]|nr:aromatic ring-hydroxylating dioxygenase subunit alpha [Blastocatellia bacterium]
MNFRDFWYVVAASKDLTKDKPASAQVLGEWLALFRGADSKAVALEDRCLHRCARLSKGTIREGRLQCAYHGWVYDGEGRVVHVPSEGPNNAKAADNKMYSFRRARTFAVCEVDDYVYVRLADSPAEELKPFPIPYYKAEGWASIRLKNLFKNNVTNCVENFVDIPHTAFVHPRIFRVTKNEKLTARVERRSGSVVVSYRNERANLGWFSRFLNPGGREITHTDSFHMPNVTSVDYIFGENRRFIITSQSVPLTDCETLVYTDLTYNYGMWNLLARPIIRRQAQTIIDQDVEILGDQMEAIKRYGSRFANTEADVIHVFIESIRAELERGADPRLLPDKTVEIEFWV